MTRYYLFFVFVFVLSIGNAYSQAPAPVYDDVRLDSIEAAFLKGIEMDEVVVSSNRNETRRIDAPVVVNVLGGDLFAAVNSVDLSGTLSYQSGLRVENNCQNCAFPQVRINGLEGPYSQILIDSRPVVSSLSGVYGLEQMPTNMIDRIEVVKGGASALFGANAVGGTINLITKQPTSNSFSLSSSLSNMDGQSMEQYVGANVSLVSKDYTYGFAAYQTYRNRNPYDRDDDGFSEVGKLKLNSFGFRSYYNPNSSSKVTLQYHTTNEFRRGGNLFDLQPHETDITEQTNHIINSGGLDYDYYFENNNKLSLYGSIQHVDRNSYYGSLQDENAYGKTNDLTWLTGATFIGHFKKLLFAPATLSTGVEYQSNKMHDQMLGHGRDLEQDVHIFGAFAQNEWTIDQLTLLVGLRADKHNLIKNLIVSPRINLMYKPTDLFQSRLSYSTGFRAPQAYDEDLHITQVGGDSQMISLADDLSPERSHSFSGSVDFTRSFGHFEANILLEGFYTQLNDVFALREKGHEDGILWMERYNASGARVYGLSLDAKIAHGKDYSLQAGFTAQRSRYMEAEEWSQTAAPTKRMIRTPDYYGYFTFTHNITKRFDYSISGVYTGAMIVPHVAPEDPEAFETGYHYITEDRMETSPDFFDLNVKLNYTFDLKDGMKLQFNGGVQNIFNQFQKDLDQGAYRDSGYFYGPVAPRTFFLGVKITG